MFGTLGFEYKPDMGDLPMLQLAPNLPLGRLADISFGVPENEGAMRTIAPSAASLPGLPNYLALPAPVVAKKFQPTSSPSTSSSAPAAPAPPSAPLAISGVPAAPSVPVAPPAPAFEAPPIAPPVDIPSAPMAPPPPAPPAPPASMDDGDAPAADGDAGGGRDDLLAAIRNKNNLKRLKKVTERVVEEKREQKSAGGGGGPMDIMGALKARLAMRHAAMTGKHRIEKKDAGGGDADDGDAAAPAAPGPTKAPKMAGVVLDAYIEAHKAKEKDDGEWDE